MKNEILLMNEYYNNGLTEQSVKQHYDKYKKLILPQIKHKKLVSFIFIKQNEYIVRRNQSSKNNFIVDDKNYDEFNSGRMVSFSVEHDDIIDYWIIDIDCNPNVDESRKKLAVKDVVNLFKDINQVSNIKVVSSGNSYHVYGYLKDSQPCNIAKEELKTILSTSNLKELYRIDQRGKSDIINLDLSIMNKRGSHTIPYVLALNGIMCKEVTNDYKTFNRREMIII